MSSSAISAAGKAPDELKPNCPKDVMNINVRLWKTDSSAATAEVTNSKRRHGPMSEEESVQEHTCPASKVI